MILCFGNRLQSYGSLSPSKPDPYAVRVCSSPVRSLSLFFFFSLSLSLSLSLYFYSCVRLFVVNDLARSFFSLMTVFASNCHERTSGFGRMCLFVVFVLFPLRICYIVWFIAWSGSPQTCLKKYSLCQLLVFLVFFFLWSRRLRGLRSFLSVSLSLSHFFSLSFPLLCWCRKKNQTG